jgi:hypothetical protein
LDGWCATFDVAYRDYRSSNLQLTIFEFGGRPVWEDLLAFRSGIEFFNFFKNHRPLRIGYAYDPQLYYSNISTLFGGQYQSTDNTKQNRKHHFTIGSTLSIKDIDINFGVEYSQLKWHRELNGTGSVVKDEYIEKQIGLFLELVYSLH